MGTTQRKVFLVGLMGAGKSAVGALVARRLGLPHLDNDLLLAEREGAHTRALADRGRPQLHEAESRQLHDLIVRPGAFVAGVAASVGDRPGDCGVLRKAGVVVYLHAAPELLAARLGEDNTRPWLSSEPLAVLIHMYEKRHESFVRTAHLLVEADQPAADIAELIARHAGTG